MKRITAVLVFGLTLSAAAVGAETRIEGAWKGAITIAGQDLGIAITFDGGGAALTAKIDIPQQGAKGVALKELRRDGAALHFELPAGIGVAVFEGIVADESIAGDFTQAGIKGSFRLTRDTAPAAATATPPPEFREIEAGFKSGDVTIAGTLSLPPGAGPFPAVILLSGSGPQNRDEELLGFRPFAILAEHLNRAGVAVLRCDDRGVGGSSGDTMASTLDDYALDAEAALAWLLARAEVDKLRVGFLGHSDGAAVASAVAAKRGDVAFLVLLAPPSVKGDELLAAQMESILEGSGVAPAEIRAERALQDQAIAAARKGEGFGEVEAALTARIRAQLTALPEEQRKQIADHEAYIQAMVAGQMRLPKSRYFRAFIDHDPRPSFRAVRCPVLAIFAGLDRQVPLAPNRAAFDQATSANKNVTVRTLPRANHLFQTGTTGLPSEYGRLAKEFTPGFLGDVASWVAKVPARKVE